MSYQRYLKSFVWIYVLKFRSIFFAKQGARTDVNRYHWHPN